MERRKIVLLVGLFIAVTLACVPTPAPGSPSDPVETEVEGAPTTAPAGTQPPPPPSGPLIQPADLTYVGAFRLPADAPDDVGWLWSGEALAYYPDGDPGGPDDGFPGSLFGTGHNWKDWMERSGYDDSPRMGREQQVATNILFVRLWIAGCALHVSEIF